MKAKLQKQFIYKYKDKRQHKQAIIISEEAANDLGCKGRQEIELMINGGQLRVTIKNESEVKER